ncbi:MAG: DUF2239 family protein [Pseudomonadota bacterium]|jgi:hypothetical protein
MTSPAESIVRPPYAVFAGLRRVAMGTLAEAAVAARDAAEREPCAPVLVFDGESGAVVDLDLRGTADEIAARYAPPLPGPARRGRPKLGVAAREVTLLPRHWDWLAGQPGGASATLRRLVEAARKAEGAGGPARRRRDCAYRFMSALAGDLPGFEAASRALFAGDEAGLARAVAAWPLDVQDQLLGYLRGANEAGAD